MPGKDEMARAEQEHDKQPTAAASREQSPSEMPEGDEDQERFVEGLVVRGEVAPEVPEPLPPGVTHQVAEEKDGVPTQVRRRRFSARG